MRKNIFEKRIPTLLALFILLSGLAVTSFLIQQGVFTIGHASPNQEPQSIEITNITQDSFTVTFTTVDQTVSGVSVINLDTPTVFFDSRNPQGNKSYSNHFITVNKLKSNTEYEFNILSNGTVYLNNGANFKAKTAAGGDLTPNLNSLTGKVLLPDGTDGKDVLVKTIIPNAAAASGVTDDHGVYTIPSTVIRTPSHDSLFNLMPGTAIKINAINGKLTSEINFTYVPGIEIPVITLSNNYSFISAVTETITATPSSQLSIPSGSRVNDVRITIPGVSQSFTDTKPQFQGTAFPSQIVKIDIGPNSEASAQVRSSPNGNWTYRPAVALSIGAHTINVDSLDPFGLTRSVSRSFNIFPSGSQIAQSATPSATPTTAVPTATPTFTPAPTFTPTPSIVVTSPTPTIAIFTPTPTPIVAQPTPTPTIFAINPPQKKVPPTGPGLLPIVMTTVSFLFIIVGSTLLFVL